METEKERAEFLKLFGKQIDKIRKTKNLSYDRVSRGCSLDASDISKIAKGNVNIKLTTVFELSIGLEIKPKELFEFD